MDEWFGANWNWEKGHVMDMDFTNGELNIYRSPMSSFSTELDEDDIVSGIDIDDLIGELMEYDDAANYYFNEKDYTWTKI